MHIIVETMKQILIKFNVQQHPKPVFIYQSNSFESLMAELSALESYTIYKKRDNSTKICNFATSL